MVDQEPRRSDVDNQDQRPIVGVSLAFVLMGIGSVIARAAEIDGSVLAFHRVWVAGLLYTALLVASGRRITTASVRVAAPGGFAFGIQIALFYSSIQLTTVANTTMIMALHPVIVLAFFSARFREIVRPRDWALSLTAVCGMGLVVFGSSSSPAWSPTGDLLAVGSLIAWSFYFSISKQVTRTLDAFEYQGMLMFSSTLLLLPVALVLGDGLNPGPTKWPWILAMVLIPGTGHMLVNWAHSGVPLGLMSQMTLISPVVSVLLAAAVLDSQTVNATQAVGMLIVVGSLAQLVRRRTPQEN